jgi:hypothetical protein
VCWQNGIDRAGGSVFTSTWSSGRAVSRTTWRFAEPTAAADLQLVRAALAARYPAWPIEADDH